MFFYRPLVGTLAKTRSPHKEKLALKGPASLRKKSGIQALPPVKKWPRIHWKTISPGPLVGLDEVGRGCLAGPVVAGAVFLTSPHLVKRLTDSKLMSEAQREELAPLIEEHHVVGIGFATAAEIDEINILQASLLAMKRALLALEQKLGQKAGHLLIDGTFKIPGHEGLQTSFIQGDLRVAPISAASIVAKVYRDRWLKQIGRDWPQYGFEQHKGYGSLRHRQAIERWGPTIWHRKSFGGVREHLAKASFENQTLGSFVEAEALAPQSANDPLRSGRAEEQRVLEYLLGKGCELVSQNQVIRGTEIDLIVRAPDQSIWIIEVKKLKSPAYFERRITPAQIKRIRQVLALFLAKSIKTRAHLALVISERVILIADFFVRDL